MQLSEKLVLGEPEILERKKNPSMDLFDFWISRKDDWWHAIPHGNSGILGHLSKVQIPIWAPDVCPKQKEKIN